MSGILTVLTKAIAFIFIIVMGYALKKQLRHIHRQTCADGYAEQIAVHPGKRHRSRKTEMCIRDRSRISCWRALQISTFCPLHSCLACSSFRNIPSPEQGASTTIPSKNPWK